MDNLAGFLPPPFAWCEIPAGSVTLEDPSAYNNGGTPGGVYTVSAFKIAKYPITNAQYALFIDDSYGYFNPIWWNYSEAARQWRQENAQPMPTRFGGDDLPRTLVNWYDAVAFCRWLMNRSGLKVTLPTEQQWQRAAQGDDGRLYGWGNHIDPTYATYGHDSNGRVTPVTHYPQSASPFGVWDMSGNVWEWCLTRWGDDSTDLESDGERVVRGGGWRYTGAESLRVAYRNHNAPQVPNVALGFRIVWI